MSQAARPFVPRLSLNLLKGWGQSRDDAAHQPAAPEGGSMPAKVTFADLTALDSSAEDQLDRIQAKGGRTAREARDPGTAAVRGSLSARGWGDKTQEGRRATYAGAALLLAPEATPPAPPATGSSPRQQLLTETRLLQPGRA